jgi:acyl-CoA synthetase (AMP-forming)/AMP-acid ligase II
VGEIAVQGPAVAPGYAYTSTPDVRSFQDGWFFTGDLGHFDERGHLFVLDRKKDVFSIDGQMIYPSQVQEALYREPGIREAAVAGHNEQLWAFVVPGRAANLSREALRSGLSEEFALPMQRVRVLIIDRLPRSIFGKLDRRLLSELAKAAA